MPRPKSTDPNADLRRRLGAAVRVVRKEQQLSQQELANRMRASQPDISNWERGIETPLLVPRLLAIDVALGVQLGEVMWRAGVHACPDSVEDLLARDPNLDDTARTVLLAGYRAAIHMQAS